MNSAKHRTAIASKTVSKYIYIYRAPIITSESEAPGNWTIWTFYSFTAGECSARVLHTALCTVVEH